nr:hypothetical protein [uncultured Holophaga sp.]
MSECPTCGAPAFCTDWNGWQHMPSQDEALSTLARLEAVNQLEEIKAQRIAVLDLVREAGDCNLLGRAGEVRERLAKAAVILQKMGEGRA